MDFSHYTIIADLFDYPTVGFPERVINTQEYLDTKYPEAGMKLKEFTDFASQATLIETEELHTRSFDVQAVTTLDIGYVLFGDDYKRGELLVNLNREHREINNDCRSELADHLPCVLRLLAKMSNASIRGELAEKMLGPAVRKMIDEFDPDKIRMKNKSYKKHHKTLIERSEKYGTLYQKTLVVLYIILKKDFALTEKKEKKQTSDFLKGVRTEMEIEKE